MIVRSEEEGNVSGTFGYICDDLSFLSKVLYHCQFNRMNLFL